MRGEKRGGYIKWKGGRARLGGGGDVAGSPGRGRLDDDNVRQSVSDRRSGRSGACGAGLGLARLAGPAQFGRKDFLFLKHFSRIRNTKTKNNRKIHIGILYINFLEKD